MLVFLKVFYLCLFHSKYIYVDIILLKALN